MQDNVVGVGSENAWLNFDDDVGFNDNNNDGGIVSDAEIIRMPPTPIYDERDVGSNDELVVDDEPRRNPPRKAINSGRIYMSPYTDPNKRRKYYKKIPIGI